MLSGMGKKVAVTFVYQFQMRTVKGTIVWLAVCLLDWMAVEDMAALLQNSVNDFINHLEDELGKVRQSFKKRN